MFVEIRMQTKDYHYEVNLLAILNLCYRRNLSLVQTLNYIVNTSYPNPSVPDDVCYLACVAGAKRGGGGGREKCKGKGAPALRAYVFA